MKKILLSSTIALGFAALGSTAALAENGPRGGQRPGFEDIDANGDGVLTLEEFQNRAQAKFDETDTNGDGFLDVEELTAAAARERARMIERLMERKDTDGDGMLSMEEMAPRDPGKFFDRADTDGNGEISLEEWEAAREKMRGRGPRGPHGPQGGDDGS